MSQEYILSLVLVVGAVLKIFKIEIDNSALEGLIGGIIALYVAYRRHAKGDITLGGFRKS
jgi:diacylglycerol kinase